MNLFRQLKAERFAILAFPTAGVGGLFVRLGFLLKRVSHCEPDDHPGGDGRNDSDFNATRHGREAYHVEESHG